MKTLFGTIIAKEIYQELQTLISSLPSPPGLAVILVGEHPASTTYVNVKRKAAEQVGMRSFLYALPENVAEKELIELIQKLNEDAQIDGILVQLPLPTHIHPARISQTIDPQKDVDGLHPENMGKLLLGAKDGFIPCTPLGIQVLLQKYEIETAGKHVVILGRSAIVGKPLSLLLLQNTPLGNATVTVAHRQTKDLKKHIKEADILIAAMGVPHFVKGNMIKKEAVVIDVGITRVNNQIVGDVDFEDIALKAFAASPVPKGVGPMTVAMLIQNTFLSYTRKK